MDNWIEKCRKLINSLQVNQRLTQETIAQINQLLVRNQFELIIQQNHRLITELRNTIEQQFNNHNTSNSTDISPITHLNKSFVSKQSDKTIEKCFKQTIVANEITSDNLKKKLYCCQWPGCGYETLIAGNISKHFCVHSGEKRFVCDWPQCGKRYKQSNGLMAHKRSHLGLKPFVCDWIGCDYKTNNRCSMPAHKRVHKGLKPFACDWPQCRISCATITHLRSHKLTHTGEKPFKCDVCDQTFTKICNMRAHKTSVHEGVKRVRRKANIDPDMTST